MKISERTAEEHTHYNEEKICLQQYERTINDKSFLFTVVSIEAGIVYSVYEKVGHVPYNRHTLRTSHGK